MVKDCANSYKNHSPKEVVEIIPKVNQAKYAEKAVKKSNLLKCDQCDHIASCKANLMIHITEEHKKVETQDDPILYSNVTNIVLKEPLTMD